MVLDVNNIQSIIQKLSINPKYPMILVGGTNGKGSVCAYLTTILTNAGYLVGTFTSPHVLQVNERIAINNQPIDDFTLNETLTPLLKYELGEFQTLTLAMHQIFMSKKIDIAIIEVGIGGAHDITNLFEPSISAITCVDFDHCAILGNTLEAIGLEKAGIYRQNKWGFFGSQNTPSSIIKYTQKIGTKLQQFGVDFGVTCNELSFDVWCNKNQDDYTNYYTLPYPALRGKEQVNNVALALGILNKLRNQFPVSLATIKSSLLKTTLIGRFHVMPGVPQVILDVAHNVQAVSHMLQNMLKLPFAKHSYAVFGVASDKDVENIIKTCTTNTSSSTTDTYTTYFDKWYIAKLASSRGLDAINIANILLKHGVKEYNIVVTNSITEAISFALRDATNNDRVVAFGSFLVVEESYNLLKNKDAREKNLK